MDAVPNGIKERMCLIVSDGSSVLLVQDLRVAKQQWQFLRRIHVPPQDHFVTVQQIFSFVTGINVPYARFTPLRTSVKLERDEVPVHIYTLTFPPGEFKFPPFSRRQKYALRMFPLTELEQLSNLNERDKKIIRALA